ncbi:hypothetical protein D0Y65_042090 [Glycine soja]|uniref:Uncharacterized protein n=1 Tax=Glycine soja TaxID=3848 RepID=A0A445GYG2_GLYSO|nr:hypothetical protein D0Y65_042090 [Glycine soja]
MEESKPKSNEIDMILEEVDKRVNITFDKPTPEMTKHLESLYVKAQINGKTLAKVFVDGGASFSIMPLTMFRKIESFTGGATAALGVLVAKITIGPKTMYLAFFIVDAKPTYSVLLGRDWIHASQFLPSTLHHFGRKIR